MVEDKYIESKIKLQTKVKNRIFDVIAAGVLLAAIAINLGALEWKEITKENAISLLAEFVPLLLTSMLLTTDFYQKGSFYGKISDKFTAIANAYSELVTNLTGREIEYMPDFCSEYNDKALRKMQEPILKSVGISYELFDKGEGETPPLKMLSRRKLSKMYDFHVVNAIQKCKHTKIKGLKINNLLGNTDIDDMTDLGKTETQLRVRHNTFSAVQYTITTALMTLIAIKDIATWGWASLCLIAFKLMFIFFKAYMSYFNGYNDITVILNNQLARKTDIIKQFKYWYENKSQLFK